MTVEDDDQDDGDDPDVTEDTQPEDEPVAGPSTDGQTRQSHDDVEPVAGPSSDGHRQSNDDVEPVTGPDIAPSDTQRSDHSAIGERRVEKITKCQKYKGKKWYLTKWENHKFKIWETEDNVPEEAVREFHISRTQSGKARKAKRRS